ncbi:MAG: carbohydrate-binding protein [Ruminococcus sp.]|nr:carbohydrate-binding protein [Ruminococcus sp.]
MKIKKLTALLTGIVTMIAGTSVCTTSKTFPTAKAAGGLVAFPGAVGAGKYATGGRGGEVYHVTNLNDSGAGSFRDAVSKSGRIVVFDISGTIELKSNILCQSNITVAGQTAPGGSGITLKNYKMGMSGDNIICRYISSRPGPYASTSSGNDAWGGAKGSNSIIDHCSMGWTTDEQWGLYSANQYYTVQYSVLGPADSWGGHSKGLHGFGIMMGKGYLTFDHNLIIHNVSRNFRGKVEGQQTADFTNNIIYDWGYQTAYGTIGHLNYVNNTLKAGNSTTGGYHWMYVDSGTKPENFKVYCAGNQLINKDGSLHAITYDNWAGVTLKESIGITMNDLKSSSAFETVLNGENVSTATTCESAQASYDHVISFAGNGIAPDKRTAIDQQCAAETKNGTGSCSGTSAYDSSQTNLDKYNIQCGVTYTYPSAVTKKEITDNDNDGMDDNWELERGLNPSDPSDTNGDYCGQGYTNIEYYINDLTVNSFPEGVVELSPTANIPAISAFETIQAESFASQEGVRTEDTSGGGQNIGYIENGDWIMFKKVDFEDGANSFTGRISGNSATMEIYIDNMNGSPAAKINFAGTSGFSDYQEFSYNIPQIKGSHNLYIKFTGGEGYLLNMDSFVFGKDSIPLSGELIKNVKVSENAVPLVWGISENAAVGSKMFGDRDFTFTELPEEVTGGEILLTACDSKTSTGTTAEFNTGKNIDLYVALDSRVENRPDWLADYEKTPLTAKSSNDVIFEFYKKNFSENQPVTIGSNGQSYMCVNFAVIAVESNNQEEITTTETTVTTTETTTTVTTAEETTTTQKITEETTTTPENTIVFGDANEDGNVSVSDAVSILQYLANSEKYPLTTQGKLNGDVDESEGITGKDAAVIQLVDAGIYSVKELPLRYIFTDPIN